MKIQNLIIIAILLLTSCASTEAKIVYKRMQERAEKDGKLVLISDAKVLAFSDVIVKLFGSNSSPAENLRNTTGTIHILASAAANANSMTGISLDEEAELITLVSDISTIISPFQEIWKMGKSGVVFQQGISMVLTAKERYYVSTANNDGVVSNINLSKDGAKLFKEVMAVMIVVTKVLGSQIPTIEDLQVASGLENGKPVKVEDSIK